MASRFIAPVFDAGSGVKPPDGAKLNFFETGTSTRKDTFNTAAPSTPPLTAEKNANPVIADANGVFPDIFISGTYKVILTDKNDVQVGFGEKDPVSETITIDVADGRYLGSMTLAQAKAITNPVTGASVKISDRADWIFEIKTGLVADGFSIVALDAPNASFQLQLRSSNVISVNALGAVGDTVADDTAVIQAAFDLAIAISTSFVYSLGGAGTNQNPVVNVTFDPAKGYRTTSTININHVSIGIVGGGRVAIVPDDFNDFIFTITGVAFRHKISGFTFESTQAGIFDYEATNVSGSLVWFDDCRFVTDQFSHESGIAVRYRNRSSELRFTQCYFNRIKHPVHNRECDFVTFGDNCWFGFALNAVYANKDAYIRNDNGFMRIHDCLFAGGPAADAGVTNGTEIAYINVGTEAVSPDVTEVHGRISITSTRIGYEVGAGALINFFTPHVASGGGTDFRNGIFIDDIQTNPREEKKKNIDDLDVASLIRLFDMPNEISLNNIHNNTGNLAVITAGSTTDLTILREKANVPVNYFDDFADQKTLYSSNDIYQIHGITCPNLFIVATDTQTGINQHNRWLELFDKFNYFFDSDFPNAGSGGNSPTINVDTIFFDFAAQLGSVFRVFGGCFPAVAGTTLANANISGTITITNENNSNFDRITPYFDSDIDYSAQANDIEITPFFVVATVEKATITNAEAANATLRIRIQHAGTPGVVNVRCRGLVVQPIGGLMPSKQNDGFIQA